MKWLKDSLSWVFLGGLVVWILGLFRRKRSAEEAGARGLDRGREESDVRVDNAEKKGWPRDRRVDDVLRAAARRESERRARRGGRKI